MATWTNWKDELELQMEPLYEIKVPTCGLGRQTWPYHPSPCGVHMVKYWTGSELSKVTVESELSKASCQKLNPHGPDH